MKLTRAIERWLGEVQLSRAASTLQIYTFNLHLLTESALIPCRLERIKPTHLIRFFNRPGRRSANTQHQQYRTIRTFTRWAHAHGLVRADPMAGVPAPPLPRPVPRHMRRDDIPRLLAGALMSDDPDRNYAIVMLFLDTGIRRAELVNLVPNDLDLPARLVTIRRGKGGGGRQVPVSQAGAAALRDWLQLRPPDLPTLFGLCGDNIGQMVHRCCERAGVPHVSPHHLRHTFATYYAGDIYDLQRILGHADVSTTAMIYAHRDAASLAAVHDQRSPVGQVVRAQLAAGP